MCISANYTSTALRAKHDDVELRLKEDLLMGRILVGGCYIYTYIDGAGTDGLRCGGSQSCADIQQTGKAIRQHQSPIAYIDLTAKCVWAA